MIQPSVCCIPEYRHGSGREAVEIAAAAGLRLDPWQAFVLENSLGENADGSWAAWQVGVCLPRQSGKSEVALVRLLAGLFLFEEELQIFSSNLFDAAKEIHRRLKGIIEGNEDLSRRVKSMPSGNGREGIELHNGCRVRFRARGAGGGRGHSPSTVIFDESMYLPENVFRDLVPAVSAQRRQQIWCLGSAADREIHPDSIVFAAMRERAMSSEPGSLAWFEWSAPFSKHEVTEEIAADPDMIMRANPAMESGRLAQVPRERDALDLGTFAVERLGAGAWPRTDGSTGVIPQDAWRDCADPDSEPLDPLVIAFDTAPHPLAGTAIAVCGLGEHGLPCVEVVDICQDVAYAPQRIAELVGKHHPTYVVADTKGATSALMPALDKLAVRVHETTAPEHAQAAAMFLNDVIGHTMRHRPVTLWAQQLEQAVITAAKRSLGDGGFAWRRKDSTTSIAPLVSCTLALWGRMTLEQGERGPLLEVI